VAQASTAGVLRDLPCLRRDSILPRFVCDRTSALAASPSPPQGAEPTAGALAEAGGAGISSPALAQHHWGEAAQYFSGVRHATAPHGKGSGPGVRAAYKTRGPKTGKTDRQKNSRNTSRADQQQALTFWAVLAGWDAHRRKKSRPCERRKWVDVKVTNPNTGRGIFQDWAHQY